MPSEQEPGTIQSATVEHTVPTDEREAVEETPKTVQGQVAELLHAATSDDDQSRKFLLRVVQPGLAGLMDGSVSTLAPLFATAFLTHRPFAAFLVGLATATGAGISMALSEALSDDGKITGRGSPAIRGGITGLMTFCGGALHTLPFLIPDIHLALLVAYVVVGVELLCIAAIRHRYFNASWWLSILQVVGGGALVFVAALLFGNA
ncbi:MAG TPA: VIT1/CCC1 transporter family protein [Ktedonobacteraceae bacterium]|jgi:VIT1/CCC1 family predicted Fe2+/Mn2+ transporter